MTSIGLDDVHAVLDDHEWTPRKTDFHGDVINVCGCGQPMSQPIEPMGHPRASRRDYEYWLTHIEDELVRRVAP